MKQLFFTIFALFLLGGCSSTDLIDAVELATDGHHLGKIVKKEEKRIFIEEIWNSYDQPLSPLWVTFDDETMILDAEDEPIEEKFLKKGQIIEVWNNGILKESYPGETYAEKIKIKQIN